MLQWRFVEFDALLLGGCVSIFVSIFVSILHLKSANWQ